MGIVYVMSDDMVAAHRAMCYGDLRVPGVEPICQEKICVGGRENEVSLWPLGFSDRHGNKLWIEGNMLHSWGSNNPRGILANLKLYARATIDDIF